MNGRKRHGVGIIGAGTIAYMHVQAYLRLSDRCELLAVADPDTASAKRLLESCGIRGADVYADYTEMLARDDIGVVSLCTPPDVRERPIVAALTAGKHVMSEKPFAASLEECDRMLAASERYGRKLAVMLQTRFDPQVRRIRHLVRSGVLGPVLYASGVNHHWRGDAYYLKPWRGTWERERGGVLMNLGIHTLDAMLWVLGGLESVQATAATLGHTIETEDTVTAALRFRGGAVGQFACATTVAAEGSAMEFAGKHRLVRYPLAYAAVCEDECGYPAPDADAVAAMRQAAAEIGSAEDGFAGPISDLFDAIDDGREPVAGAADVRATVEAVTAMYKSAATGAAVRLPIGRDDPCYTTEGLHRLMRDRRGRQ